jgi:3-hydroxyisobutyrate dehydrogenase
MAKIGFVGLGHMGLPMALHLVHKGHQVIGYDLQEAPLATLVSAGGLAATSVAECATNQEIFITMLQTGQQVREVGDALFSNARPQSLYMDCSTIDVQTSRDMHHTAQKHQLLSVDAPVSGGVAAAKAASLTFMVGGTKESYQQAKPILSCMGKNMIHTGLAGSGQAAKICNNMILGISMIAVSEAFVLARQLGLAEEKLFEVVNNASGQCWALSKYVPVPGILDNVPANNQYQPGFTAQMMLKDLRLSQDLAESVGVKTLLGEQATAMYQRFIEEGAGMLDFSGIIQWIAKNKDEF